MWEENPFKKLITVSVNTMQRNKECRKIDCFVKFVVSNRFLDWQIHFGRHFADSQKQRVVLFLVVPNPEEIKHKPVSRGRI